MQRGLPAVTALVDRGTFGQQQFGAGQAADLDGAVERGAAGREFGPGGEERFERCYVAGLRGAVERGDARAVGRVGVGAGGEQLLDNGRAAGPAGGGEQRRHAIDGRHVSLGALGE